MIIKNTKTRCIRVGKVVLKPGVNVLNKEQESLLEGNLDFMERLVENKVLEVPTLEKASEEEVIEAVSIENLSAKDSIAIIKETYDKALLEEFMDTETGRDDSRSSVIKAIGTQINKIEDAQTKDDDDDDEDDD